MPIYMPTYLYTYVPTCIHKYLTSAYYFLMTRQTCINSRETFKKCYVELRMQCSVLLHCQLWRDSCSSTWQCSNFTSCIVQPDWQIRPVKSHSNHIHEHIAQESVASKHSFSRRRRYQFLIWAELFSKSKWSQGDHGSFLAGWSTHWPHACTTMQSGRCVRLCTEAAFECAQRRWFISVFLDGYQLQQQKER